MLSSLSDEDMTKLKTAAAELMQNMNSPSESDNDRRSQDTPRSETEKKSDNEKNTDNIGIPNINPAALLSLGKIMNSDDDRTRFIEALKPLLSPNRQQKADEALKLMRIMNALPALRDSGIFTGLIT